MSVEERAAFDAWRADPQNLAALNAMHAFWGEMSALKGADSSVKSSSTPSRRLAIGGAVAACLLVGGLFASWAVQPLAFAETTRTHVGEQRSETLPDGSVVNLNVATRIDYRMHDRSRDVRLREGQALFVVRKDPSRPFRVRAGDYEVRAVGTAFDVRQRDGGTQVAVQEGVVLVTRLNGPQPGAMVARLKAGEKLELRPPAHAAEPAVAVVKPVPVQSVAEWRTRTLSYEDASVAEVVEDLNRFFPQPIEIEDQTLAARRVTIRLQVADRESTVRTLNALLGTDLDPKGQAAASR
jgi:transmembrane sensor